MHAGYHRASLLPRKEQRLETAYQFLPGSNHSETHCYVQRHYYYEQKREKQPKKIRLEKLATKLMCFFFEVAMTLFMVKTKLKNRKPLKIAVGLLFVPYTER